MKLLSKVNVNMKNYSLHVFSNGGELTNVASANIQGFLSLNLPFASEQVKGLDDLILASNSVFI